MITVAVLINGRPLYARSAVNTSETTPEGDVLYRVDDGDFIAHDYHKGAIPLAIKMLESIQTEGIDS